MHGCGWRVALAAMVVTFAWGAAGTTPRAAARQAVPQSLQQPPKFAASTVLVPIDVRVFDPKTGKAVTDLVQEDFTLLEDGTPQPIRHFERRVFEPGAAAAGRPATRESALGVLPQTSRVFLFMLGRGRLQEPSKALDALQRFVREQMLPQDHVAVFAYDRATDFTTDHELVARFLDRFKRDHYQIDMEIGLAVDSGLAGIYGSQGIPKSTQAKIDAMFTGSGTLESRKLEQGEPTQGARINKDVAKQTDQLQREQLEKANRAIYAESERMGLGGPPPPSSWSSLDVVAANTFTTLPLDDFVENTARSLQDLGNCFAAIEYLRYLEGDKHLVFVTERGMNLPRLEDDMDLVKVANDARVAIDTFQVGGLQAQVGGAWTDQSQQTFAFKALRMIAEQTGGVSSISEDGMVAVNRINEVSKTEYVLGYYPEQARLDGSYRKIEVKVRRPGATVLYRRGYFARTSLGSFDRRSFITKDRLMAAAGFRRTVNDIKLKMDAKVERVETGTEVAVRGTIDTSRLFFNLVDGKHVGSIDILVVCFDEKLGAIGQNYQRASVELTDEAFAKVSQSGLPYNVRFAMSPAVRSVRLIVYDYRADLIGSADKRVF
jgi:VWFA-related protein